MVLGPKYYNLNGIWALKPYYLGPWTLRGEIAKQLGSLPLCRLWQTGGGRRQRERERERNKDFST